MAIGFKHSDTFSTYYCTFTCHKWLPLFELTNSYDIVYHWFDVAKEKFHMQVIAFVIMPNHLHFICYFPQPGFNLNSIISNAKRFMAYEVINRLEKWNNENLIAVLMEDVTKREALKGQLHKVFKNSFDAKAIFSEKFLHQKIKYIHLNPVRGKWMLVTDYTKHPHSSASFYEEGIVSYYKPFHYKEL